MLALFLILLCYDSLEFMDMSRVFLRNAIYVSCVIFICLVVAYFFTHRQADSIRHRDGQKHDYNSTASEQKSMAEKKKMVEKTQDEKKPAVTMSTEDQAPTASVQMR